VLPLGQKVRALAPATAESAREYQSTKAQGLKPAPLLRLYGTTKVVP
jgi:hypothetical protein